MPTIRTQSGAGNGTEYFGANVFPPPERFRGRHMRTRSQSLSWYFQTLDNTHKRPCICCSDRATVVDVFVNRHRDMCGTDDIPTPNPRFVLIVGLVAGAAGLDLSVAMYPAPCRVVDTRACQPLRRLHAFEIVVARREVDRIRVHGEGCEYIVCLDGEIPSSYSVVPRSQWRCLP